MAHSRSRKKNVRQNVARRKLNHWRKRRLKDQTKVFLQAAQAGDRPTAESEFRKVCGLLDRFATTSTMHRNTAARRKSRLNRVLKAVA